MFKYFKKYFIELDGEKNMHEEMKNFISEMEMLKMKKITISKMENSSNELMGQNGYILEEIIT